MPHTPPIDIKALVKNGILNEDRFYNLLSAENNYVDIETIKDFYMGLVRLLTSELRKNGVVRLPHLGDMALVKSKDKLGWSGKYQKMQIGKYMLKFYATQPWRIYFSKLSERTGREGALDPREKIFGRTL